MLKKKVPYERLNADYKANINKPLQDDQYPSPNLDILATTMGGMIFTTFDIKQAFIHFSVHGNTTVTTPKGDYKVNQLMFGTKVAPCI